MRQDDSHPSVKRRLTTTVQELLGGMRVTVFDRGQDAGDFIHRQHRET
jgi:hypothetical protein